MFLNLKLNKLNHNLILSVSEKQALLIFFLFFGFILLLSFHQVIFFGQTFFRRDFYRYFYPMTEFMKNSFLQGEIPLWNPYIFAGTPQAPILDPSLVYPFNIIFILFPTLWAMNINIIIHILLAGFGMYILGKLWNFKTSTCYIMAFSYSLSGYLFSVSGNLYTILFALTWIPYCLYFLQKLLDTPCLKNILYFALIIALQILSGRVEICYATFILLFLYGLYSLLIPLKQNICTWCKMPKINKSRTFLFILAGFILAGLFSSIQILPVMEFIKHSVRAEGLNITDASIWSLNPLQLVSLIVPNFFENLRNGFSITSLIGDSERGYGILVKEIYMGGIILFLSIIAVSSIFFKEKNNEISLKIVFWLFIFLLFLILSSGTQTPVFSVGFNLLPGFNMIRYPLKLFSICVFTLCILAGYGMEIWQKTASKKLFVLLIFTSILEFILFYYTFHLVTSSNTLNISDVLMQNHFHERFFYFFFILIANLIVLSLWLINNFKDYLRHGLLILLLVIDLFGANITQLETISYKDFFTPSAIGEWLKPKLGKDPQVRFMNSDISNQTQIPLAFLKEYPKNFASFYYSSLIFKDDISLNHKLHNAFGYSSSALKNLNKLITTIGLSPKIKGDNILPAILGIKYLVIGTTEEFKPNKDYHILEQYFPSLQMGVFSLKKWLPRVYFRTEAMITKLEENMWLAIAVPAAYGFSPFNHVMILADNAFNDALAKVPSVNNPDKKITAPIITNETANTITIEISTNNSGYLVLSDNYYPGWQVFDNGTESPILLANYFQKALRIGTGHHIIKFIYNPKSFYMGMLISLISIFSCCIVILCNIKSHSPKLLKISFVCSPSKGA